MFWYENHRSVDTDQKVSRRDFTRVQNATRSLVGLESQPIVFVLGHRSGAA